ncbi:GAF and ANTAR domain-containing protein [Streptomyces sp. B6B3]|uniref:ANTAR domain-containing response regulator n=1 Tax=Streptomyces sp. B6B3 TaxID=3153570 RepID=UPI00325C4DD8
MSDHAPAALPEPPGLIGAGPPASMLVKLAEQAAACAPACCGAAATLTIDESGPAAESEPPTGLTHPDLAPLVAVQWESGEGPIPAAIRTGEPAGTDDLLAEDRWPEYRTVALDAGVRSCATLPFRHEGVTVTVTVCGFRPGLMDDQTRTATALVGDLATHTLVRDQRFEEVLTEADQLDTAIRTRPVVDQACGILMHILGCDAETAFEILRQRSQRTNSKLVDLAKTVVGNRGRGVEAEVVSEPHLLRGGLLPE